MTQDGQTGQGPIEPREQGQVPDLDGDKGQQVIEDLWSGLNGAKPTDRNTKVRDLLEDPVRLGHLLVFRQDRPGHFGRIEAQLRMLPGGTKVAKTIGLALDELEARNHAAELRAKVAKVPAEVPEGWRAPPGFEVTTDGVFQVHDPMEEPVRLSQAPLWVVGRLIDLDTDEHMYRLAWRDWHGGVAVHTAPRSVTADARAILGLLSFGCPVDSTSARGIVRYLESSAAHNAEVLPVESVASRCGWVHGGFLLGDQWFGRGSPVALQVEQGGGMEQIAGYLKPSGTFEGWCATAELAQGHPLLWLSLYASIASVLLVPLDLPSGFVVDISGSTSQGKTTALGFGASVWGSGRLGDLVKTWEQTESGLEGLAGFLQNLPVCLDDSKDAPSPEFIAGTIYRFARGQGKGRAKPGRGSQAVGLRRTITWRSVLLSTGEGRATASTNDAGARARTLSLEGPPLGSRRQAEAIATGLEDHHGHLGPRVVQLVLDTPQAELQAAFHEARARFAARLEGASAVAGRLATPIAVLWVAAQLCRRVGVPDPECDPFAVAVAAAVGGGKDADNPARALRALYGECVRRSSEFCDGQLSARPSPPRGWLGAWEPDDGRGGRWEHVDVDRGFMQQFLARAGFEPAAIEGAWKDRGWLARYGGRWTSKPYEPSGRRMRCFRITRAALVEVGVVDA